MGNCDVVGLREFVVRIVRVLDSKPKDTILDSWPQIVHIQPFGIIVVASTTDSVTVVGDNHLPAHRGPRASPCNQVIIIVADAQKIIANAKIEDDDEE